MSAVELVGELLKLTILVGLTIAGVLSILVSKKGSTSKATYLRLFVQGVSEVSIFMVISYSLWLGVVLAVLMFMTIFVGRFFCGWICPFGFYMDLVTLLRRSLKWRYLNFPERLNVYLHRLRYVLLLVLFIVPFVLVGPLIGELWPLGVYLLGPFNALRILLGPMVPIVTPWKTFFGLNLNFPYVDQIIHYFTSDFALALTLLFVDLTLVGSFVVRRFWCRFCPTGSSFGVVNRVKGLRWIPLVHLTKEEGKCTKCGICKRVCPVQVTEIYERKGGTIETSMCILCLRCVEMCPSQDALNVKMATKTVFRSRNWLDPSKSE